MKNILRSLIGGLAAAAFVVVAQAANLAPGAFSAGTVMGDVTYKLAGSSQYMALTSGTALPQGATIKVGNQSLASVVFSNGAVAVITANSEVEITKFEQEVFSGPVTAGVEPSLSNTELKVIDGSVVSKVAKLKSGSNYVVNSPVGAAGVRGTVFNVTYDSATGSYTVSVVEGGVAVTYTGGQLGSTTDLVVEGGNTFTNGQIRAITADEIRAIEDAINLRLAGGAGTGTGGPGPGGQGASGATPNTTINVSIN